MHDYALCLARGTGVPRDLDAAHGWMRNAAAGGHTLAKERAAAWPDLPAAPVGR